MTTDAELKQEVLLALAQANMAIATASAAGITVEISTVARRTLGMPDCPQFQAKLSRVSSV